jgi:hypothetical protein
MSCQKATLDHLHSSSLDLVRKDAAGGIECGGEGTRGATHSCRDREAWCEARERKWTAGIFTGIDRNGSTAVVLQRDGAAMDPMPSTAAYILFVAHWSSFSALRHLGEAAQPERMTEAEFFGGLEYHEKKT